MDLFSWGIVDLDCFYKDLVNYYQGYYYYYCCYKGLTGYQDF